MTLVAGMRLGPYEIHSLIGAGGMGEVYRAYDARLGRTVAIKVLPPGAAADAERRRRFEQEARAIAALNHPNICVLHDIGAQNSIDFLVMECLDGETLASRLRKGPMPLTATLELGATMCDALSRAHRQGIVHHDFKPANVMLTRDGPKLLDFGLARLKPHPFAADGEGMPTISTRAATAGGALMGTVPYMAPEQLEGKEADARADLFAFGCVLYEMLTGRRAFPGNSEASVISAIMSSDPPPVSALQPVTPPALDRLIARCLRKDRDERAESAHDIAEELRSLAETIRAGEVSTSGGRRKIRWWIPAAAVVALLAFVGLTGAWWVWRQARMPRESALPLGEIKVVTDSRTFAFAPDGTGFVFSGQGLDGNVSLYWMGLADSQAQQLEGTEGASQPFFKPDGSALGFARQGKLFRVAFSRGQIPPGAVPTYVAEAPRLRGAAWAADGTIIFSPEISAGLWRASEDGGAAQELTQPQGRQMSHRWPRVVPGRRMVLFTLADESLRLDKDAIGLLDLASKTWTKLVDGGSDPHYLPSGHVVYASVQNSLLAVPVDLSARRAAGPPQAVLTGVQTATPGLGVAAFDVSTDGRLVYVAAQPPARQTLVLVARAGSVETLDPERRVYHPVFGLSRDGTRLAAPRNDGLSVLDMTTKEWRPLTQPGAGAQRGGGWTDVTYPVWSPNSDEIVFSSTVEGAFNLFTVRVDGTGQATRLMPKTKYIQYAFAWTKGYIAYQQTDSKTGWNTHIYRIADQKSWRWGEEGKNTTLAAFSPDGRWLAYQATQAPDDAQFDVFVGPFPGPGEPVRVSGKEGGKAPVWSSDGKEIFYLPSAVDNRVLASRVDGTGSPFRVLDRSYVAFALPFPLQPVGAYQQRVFAVSPQGKLLTFKPEPEPGHSGPDVYALGLADHVRIITNWPEMVKAKLAAQR